MKNVNNQLEQVLADSKNSLKANPKDRKSLINMVGYYLKNGDVKKSIEYNDLLLAHYPDDYNGIVNNGLIHVLEKSYTLGQKSFKKAIGRDPNGFDAYYNLAELVLEFGGDRENAKYFYRKALEVAPDNYRTMNRLATIYFDENKTEKCFEMLKRAYELKNDDREIINDLGLFYLRTNRFNIAEPYFKRLIELYQDWRGYYHLGITSLKSGFLDLALQNFKKAYSIKSDEPLLMNDYAFSLIKYFEKKQEKKWLQKALKIIRKVLKKSPEFPSALMNYGVILEYSGKLDDAIKCYEKLLKLTPENVPALVNYALLQMNHVKNFKKSSEILEKAMILDPYNYAARYNFAITLYRLGMKVRALLELKRISDAVPGTTIAQYAKELMKKINK